MKTEVVISNQRSVVWSLLSDNAVCDLSKVTLCNRQVSK